MTAPASAVSNLLVLEKPLERLSKADPSKIQEIATSQIELLSTYYALALDQARKSFWSAHIFGGIGVVFFLAATAFIVFQHAQNISVVSGMGGALAEVISGINFYLYAKASAQLSDFQTRLDATQRFLLANSVCEGLQGDVKQQARAELVRIIATNTSKAVSGTST